MSKSTSDLNAPENRVHNLDITAEECEELGDRPPVRDVSEADFAAEAHGFTGFERVDKGSRYRRK